jgi:folate-binding protein YgfZ
MSESPISSDPLGYVAGTHEMVAVEGPGAGAFLQGILSQDVETVEEGKARRSLLLGPQGKLRALLWLARKADRFEIFADAGRGGLVRDDLAHYKIRVKATIHEAVPAWQVLGASRGVPAPLATGDRYLVDQQPTDLPEVSLLTWTPLRIEAGEPVMGVDVDEKTIPQETGLVEEAVSLSKGCYLGQELVARIDSRGRVNRRLRGLRLASPAPVGATLTSGEASVGTLTSAAWSPRLEAHVGMALVHRTVGPGEMVEVGDGTAEIVELPF